MKLFIAIALSIACLLLAQTTLADDAVAPPPLVAPVAMQAGAVSYPEGASGEAVVVVELLVSDAGFVRNAHVTSGEEPFAGATLTASSGWTFTPARRGDTDVAARIRMRFEFHPPTVERVPPPLTDAGALQRDSGADAGRKSNGVEEVVVRGHRVEVGVTHLGGGEVRQIPGAFGDAFRAIEALPGVTPIVSGLPFFFVRGAPPGNTGYFLDGVRVPLLYHLALGPSVVHPGLIESVDFYPGGYPARYGRYAGGILDGQTLAPARKVHGEANVRLFDAGALVEAPLVDGRDRDGPCLQKATTGTIRVSSTQDRRTALGTPRHVVPSINRVQFAYAHMRGALYCGTQAPKIVPPSDAAEVYTCTGLQTWPIGH